MPKKYQITPGKYEVSPGRNEIIPGKNEVSPGKNLLSPGKDEVNPKKNEVTPKKSEIATKKCEVAPEESEVAPEKRGKFYGPSKNFIVPVQAMWRIAFKGSEAIISFGKKKDINRMNKSSFHIRQNADQALFLK